MIPPPWWASGGTCSQKSEPLFVKNTKTTPPPFLWYQTSHITHTQHITHTPKWRHHQHHHHHHHHHCHKMFGRQHLKPKLSSSAAATTLVRPLSVCVIVTKRECNVAGERKCKTGKNPRIVLGGGGYKERNSSSWPHMCVCDVF